MIVVLVQLIFLGINVFLALLRFILALAKMSSESGQKHIFARKHQHYSYVIQFWQRLFSACEFLFFGCIT